MLFSDRPRLHYRNAPVHEVICQLRFPTILSINTAEPADFQEAIRDTFPQYIRRQDAPPPKLIGAGGPNVRLEQQPLITNYHFLSEDNRWKLNLTRDFIALSARHYDNWEEFASHLDRALAEFIQIYKPAYFQRVGLRYVNLFSRTKLHLEGRAWRELLSPPYTGILAETAVNEDRLTSYGTDFVLQLDNSCQAKVHAGYARLQNRTPGAAQDPEVKFALDLDLSMRGNVPCTMAAGALETLHLHGGTLFEGALTDSLRQAMDPL